MYKVMYMPEQHDVWLTPEFWYIQRPDGTAVSAKINSKQAADELCRELNSLIEHEEFSRGGEM